MIKRFGFTLAEVLITLGIIGVVAAMTMPVIIANVRDKALDSAYKKTQSTIINGYKLLMSKESVLEVSALPLKDCGTDKSCLSAIHKGVFNVVQDSADGLKASDMTADYVTEDGSSSPFKWSSVPYLFRTADGVNYGVELETSSGSEPSSDIIVYADVNGNKSPSTACKDMFKFRISGTGQIANVCTDLANGGKCSLDNPAACDYESCMALDQSVNPYMGYTCGWDSKGHCIHVSCDEGGNTKTDYCEDQKAGYGWFVDPVCK